MLLRLDTFLIFPNFVSSQVLSHLVTREATRIYDVYMYYSPLDSRALKLKFGEALKIPEILSN